MWGGAARLYGQSEADHLQHMRAGVVRRATQESRARDETEVRIMVEGATEVRQMEAMMEKSAGGRLP